MSPDTKTISLNDELLNLGDALDAVMILAAALQNEGLSTEDDQRRAPGAILAVATLVSCRLKNLRRLLRGTLDADGFWGPHNAAPTRLSAGDEPDVLIPTKRREHSKRSSK